MSCSRAPRGLRPKIKREQKSFEDSQDRFQPIYFSSASPGMQKYAECTQTPASQGWLASMWFAFCQ